LRAPSLKRRVGEAILLRMLRGFLALMVVLYKI
jgi:hypothetical protein